MMRIVDISGYGHSGKSVITDLLKEFEGYQVPHYNFEFNLIRIQGGIIDLKHALVDNWSPIRSDAAIRRFLKLVKRIGPKANITNPLSLFHSNGMNYDDYFQGNFTRLSNDYIESLIDYIHIVEWPYPIIEEITWKQFKQRLLRNTHIKEHFSIPVYTSAPSNFIELTQRYLNGLFESSREDKTKVMVMHNAIEPFNPSVGLHFFYNAKSIIVQRDPRDIYASTMNISEGFIPKFEHAANWRQKSSFLNTDDVDHFIKRQLLYFNKADKTHDGNQVLRLNYEDIILDYENCLKKIYHFLEEEDTIHTKKGSFFNPELSKKNIGLWKKLKKQDAVKKIEESLSEYCFYK